MSDRRSVNPDERVGGTAGRTSRGLDLTDRLARGLRRCSEALVDYESGLLDDEALRRELVAAGVVSHGGVLWFIDLGRGGWCRFDGVNVEFVTDPGPEAGS